MNLLFWNLYKHQNVKIIKELLNERNVDVAFFCEYTENGMDNLINELKGKYYWSKGYGGCGRVTAFVRNGCNGVVRREHSRFVVYNVCDGNENYVIAAVHLQDRMNHTTAKRIDTAKAVLNYVNEQKRKLHIDKIVIIGDFNANPFDEELIAIVSFNSVLFKSVMKKEEIKSEGVKYRYLYNPILQFIRDDDGKRGSYYYSSGDAPLYWNCFDQVLMNKRAMTEFVTMEYITRTVSTDLQAQKGPNKKYSDHYPLFVTFQKGEE